MRTQPTKSRRILIYCGMVLIVMCAVGVTATRQKPDVRLPKIVSKVKSLEVVSVTLEGQDESTPTVGIEIRNNSERPVIAVALEQGDGRDAYGMNTNGYRGDEPPVVVIEPHGTIKVEVPLSNLKSDAPLRVAGVVYADDTEEGDEETLGTMRRQQAHEKAKRKAKKGGLPQ